MKYLVPLIICVCFKFVLTENKIRRSGGTQDYNYVPPWNDLQLGYNYVYPYSSQVVLLGEQQINPHPQVPVIPVAPPLHPIQIPQYLPTQVPIVHPPTAGYDPIPVDDTVVIYPPNHQSYNYLPPSTGYGVPSKSPQVKVLNMSCMDSGSHRYFRSLIHTPQILETLPVIDNAKSDCVQGSGDSFKIELSGNQLIECGVRYCSSSESPHLCATIRFPTLRGLKLSDDFIINLQCKPQERVASHTKHLKVNPQIVQGRTPPSVATGGAQKNFVSQVSLLRRGPDSTDFNQVVTPGSAVNLGEDLLLKAAVREGDGWKYSRIGAVTMQHVASTKTATLSATKTNFDTVTMVDSLGCRVPSMKSVCPEHPRQVSSLITTMPFRAFMFQGANSGDEMVLSIRMLGCLLYEDCFPTRSCEESPTTKMRVKRNVNRENSTLTDWQSYLEFKVVLPNFAQPSGIKSQSRNVNIDTPALLLGGLVTVAISLSAYLIVTLLKRNPKLYS